MATSSSSTVATIPFNGSSTYSADFQNVLNHAVQVASLPMQSAQQEVTTLQSQQTALSGLDTAFTTLETDIQNISAAVSGAPSAQSSNPSALTATATSSALNGTYSVQIDNPGSAATALSSDGLTTVTDPASGNIASASSFTLSVSAGTGNSATTSTYTITPSGSSLDDLATAINAAGDGVQATVVNIGSSASPDYRLALTSTAVGPETLQLSAGSQALMTDPALNNGAYAQYSVNGSSEIQSTSNQVTLAPGLTVNLLQQTSSPVTITVSTSYSALQSALQTFANDYNSAASAVAQQHGQNAGALAGQSIVYQLGNLLGTISQYAGSSPSGSVKSLSDLGLSIDQSGNLSFNASTFSAANPTAVQQFLGNVTSSGFLQSASNALTVFTDPTTGLLQSEDNSIQDNIKSENTYISQEQARITTLQTSLEQQLSAADAAIATLQSQNTYFQDLFTAQYGTGKSGG
jgi:flagellar hook-associated protein 2